MTSSIPTSQRAIQFTAPQPLQTITLNPSAPIPPFPSDKSQPATLVKVISASLNPVDYKLASLPLGLPRLAIGASPMIPATDFVGHVARTTDPSLAAGDLVFGKLDGPSVFGTCAEYTLVKGTGGITKIPSGWSTTGRSTNEFAGLGVCVLTALTALRKSSLPWSTTVGIQRGGKVFINGGSGGVGTFTIQLAKNVLGCTDIVTSCSGSNVALVKELGATEVIDYRSTGAEGVPGALKKWAQTNGQFDAVIDLVGSDMSIYWRAHDYLKPGAQGGRYIQIGAQMSLGGFSTMAKVAIWPAILGGGQRPWTFKSMEPATREDLDMIANLMVEGKLRCVIDDENVFDLADGKKAYDKLNTGRIRGKVIVTCGQ